MSLEVYIDGNGHPHTEFRELRARLISNGDTFARHLHEVAYAQLPLCAIANAGTARCHQGLVSQEMKRRRRRFQHLDSDRLAACERYLKAEQMFVDVLGSTLLRDVHSWDSLELMPKLWFKLTCLYSHLELPHYRFQDAFELARQVIEARLWSGRTAYKCLRTLYKLTCASAEEMGQEDVRGLIGGMTEDVFNEMGDEQRAVCQTDLLHNYQCTGGCFQPEHKILR